MTSPAGRLVPALLGVLALVVLGANGTLVYLATSDPSFAVEEDYYQKALDWDAKRAQDAHNAELGWTLELALGGRTAEGRVTVTVSLRDAAERPIEDARVRLAAFHNARAAHVLRAELDHAAGASYAAALPLVRPGLWEFRIEAERGAERFTVVTMRELVRR